MQGYLEDENSRCEDLQGYLPHNKTPSPLGPPYDPRHRPTVWSQGGVFSLSEVPLYATIHEGTKRPFIP